MNPQTRNDIEGLRALAVLCVLANHAFPKVLPGGFAGVDIFFVISGYLIGGHLLQDIQARRLSIWGFYAKRVRRIFPSLALVLVSVWSVGWVVYSAPEFASLGKHMAAAALFSNNVLLWSESGYFDTAAINKPLLHLWSLGIEEQFYLLIPTMLWAASRGSIGSVRWVARFGALSLLAMLLLGNFAYAATFYLLHTRFWELAAGVILAQIELRKISLSKWDVRELRLSSFAIIFTAVLIFGADHAPSLRDSILMDSGLALAIVVASAAVFFADRIGRWDAWQSRIATACTVVGALLTCIPLATLGTSNWPGAQTLLIVIGVMLLIAAKPMALFNRLLAWKPLAFVGGISYPLYLWHWPVMVFWRLMRPETRGVELLLPLAASFVLAWLTKAFLEDPVRFGQLGSTAFRRPALGPVVSGLVFAGFLGLWVDVAHGLPGRFPPVLRAIAAWPEFDPNASWRTGRCYIYLNNSTQYSSECTPAKRNGIPLILLWGDSHAAHLYSGIAGVQATQAFDVAQWTSAGCPPTVQALRTESGTCASRRATALIQLAQLKPDTVVLGGAWARYMEEGQSADGIVDSLSETIRYLKSLGARRIVVFGPGPLWTTSLPIDLFRSMVSTRSNEIPERLGKVSDEVLRLDRALEAQSVVEGVRYVSIVGYFCNPGGCMTLGDKTLPQPDLLYGDRDHLTATGSRLLIEHSRRQLFGAN